MMFGLIFTILAISGSVCAEVLISYPDYQDAYTEIDSIESNELSREYVPWLPVTVRETPYLNSYPPKETLSQKRYASKAPHSTVEYIVLQSLFWLVSFVTNYFKTIIVCLIGGIFYLILSKCYWSPATYVKDLSEVGFNHIPQGPTRCEKITRARLSRKLGTKLPPPYPNGWFAVTESRELKVGQVVYVTALGENLAVYRGEDKQVRCIDAYCPHLGANMALGGKVRGNCIECPFHEWRFDGDGTCSFVPGHDHPPRGISVKSWITKEVDFIVWIWYDAEGREPQWSVETLPNLLKWGYRGRNEFIVNTHVQDITENGGDLAHLNAIHAPSIITHLPEKYPFLSNILGKHFWTASSYVRDNNTFVLDLKHEYKCGTYSFFHIDIQSVQIGPGHVRLRVHTLGGPIMVIMSITPISYLEQKVVFRFYSPFLNALIAAGFMIGESQQFQRDVAVWNNKCYVGSPTYSKSDKTLRAFRTWFTQFYSENSLSFVDAIKKQNNPLDW